MGDKSSFFNSALRFIFNTIKQFSSWCVVLHSAREHEIIDNNNNYYYYDVIIIIYYRYYYALLLCYYCLLGSCYSTTLLLLLLMLTTLGVCCLLAFIVAGKFNAMNKNVWVEIIMSNFYVIY